MALTQRLEFRQSQSLVMTPQLMQAIKLLQLSNLDLSTFVEEELERNPLLDRASDGPEPTVAGEPSSERVEYAESDGSEGGAGDDYSGSADGFEPGQEDWMSRFYSRNSSPRYSRRTSGSATISSGLPSVRIWPA